MSNSSVFSIQSHPDRGRYYRSKKGIEWSGELRRWMVFDANLISQILKDPRFVVHDYKYDQLLDKYGVKLPNLSRMRDFVPLVHEGSDHAVLRERMTREISRNMTAATQSYQTDLTAFIDRHFRTQPTKTFCLAQDIFLPALRNASIAISGLTLQAPAINAVEHLDELPLFFDDITLKQRKQLDFVAAEILRALPPEMEDDERYFRLAMLMVGLGTLSSSIVLSIKTILERSPSIPLNRIEWDPEPPATGLPIVERKARETVDLAGSRIAPNDSLRLYIDAAGFREHDAPRYDDLYFAVGPHQCVGKAFTRRIWKISSDQMQRIDRSLTIQSFLFRSRDNLFNFLDRLAVTLHD